MEPLGNGNDSPLPEILPGRLEDEQQVIWAAEYSEDGSGQFSSGTNVVVEVPYLVHRASQPNHVRIGFRLLPCGYLLSFQGHPTLDGFPPATKLFCKESNIVSP